MSAKPPVPSLLEKRGNKLLVTENVYFRYITTTPRQLKSCVRSSVFKTAASRYPAAQSWWRYSRTAYSNEVCVHHHRSVRLVYLAVRASRNAIHSPRQQHHAYTLTAIPKHLKHRSKHDKIKVGSAPKCGGPCKKRGDCRAVAPPIEQPGFYANVLFLM